MDTLFLAFRSALPFFKPQHFMESRNEVCAGVRGPTLTRGNDANAASNGTMIRTGLVKLMPLGPNRASGPYTCSYRTVQGEGIGLISCNARSMPSGALSVYLSSPIW